MDFYHIDPLFYHFDRKRAIGQRMKNKHFPEVIPLRRRAMKAILFFWKISGRHPRKM
jgi:hypothetical protein